MAKFQLGGHEIKQGTGGEAVNALDENKTMVISKLTGDDAFKPEVVSGLKTISDVFNHYKPNAEIEFEDAEGNPVENKLDFNSVGDFGMKGLSKNSEFLQDLEAQRTEYHKFIKMLKIKQMGNIINDADAKQSYVNALQSMINELESTGA